MSDNLHPLFPLQLAPISHQAASMMLEWHYPPPYDIYNVSSANPDDLAATIEYLLHPDNQFFEISHSELGLAGFCSFGYDGQVPGGDYSQPGLDIGMGVRPDLTGQGFGKFFAQAVLRFGTKKFQPALFRVTIAAFNKRAQRVWQRQGFQSVQKFVHQGTKRPFIIFTRQG
jgi:ribosomal-protein-alanine N-acetyltransferase